MDIHKPRPIHSWRELLSEVGVITIGVLIALGLEQAVEAFHWHKRVERARADIGQELRQDATFIQRISVSHACLSPRVEALGAILQDARRTGNLPPIGSIGAPELAPVFTTAWETAKSGGVIEHMGHDEVGRLAPIYELIRDTPEYVNERERSPWMTLRLMEGPGGRIDATLLTQLLIAWAQLHERTRASARLAKVSVERLTQAGYGPNPDAAALDRIRASELCRPMAR